MNDNIRYDNMSDDVKRAFDALARACGLQCDDVGYMRIETESVMVTIYARHRTRQKDRLMSWEAIKQKEMK